MANTDLAVRIATIFDSSGLKKADKGFDKLNKGAKDLGKSLGLALSVTAVVAFGKASVKAALEAEKANQRLAGVVKNLGLSFSTAGIQKNLDEISAKSGIAGEVLVDAFQPLLTTTGSVIKSQELLNLALDVSVGSGTDLATVTQDLANAYVGNTKGLKKYNLGLTQAELKTMSFARVQGLLNEQFTGANSEFLGTYAGKMQVLTEAAGAAQEKIGVGLIDALAKLSGGTTTADAVKTIDNIATGINSITSAVAGAIGALVKLYGWFDRTAKTISENYPDPFGVRDDKPTYKSPRMSSPAGTWQRTKQQREAEAAAAKRAKELAALQKKQVAATKALTAEQKKQAALKKAGTMFDLEQIGIIAALKGNISEEEQLRLKLQLAIITENDKEASALTLKLAQAQGLSKDLSAYLADLPDAKNPFASWSAYLDMIIEKARLAAAFGATGGSSQRDLVGLTPTVSSLVTNAVTGGAGSTSSGDVYITVNGSVLSEQDLVSAVQNGLNYNALAGKRSDIGRIAGMFG